MIMLPLFMECVCIPDPTPVVFTHLWPDKKKKRKHPERKYFNIFLDNWQLLVQLPLV